MDMPTIHMCTHLTEENEKISRKLKNLKRKNNSLEKQLTEINDKVKLEKVLKQYVTTRDSAMQTDPPGYHPYSRPIKQATTQKQEKHGEETARINKILTMHNNLMKRYEKEVKSNTSHIETISTLNLRIYELEQQLKQLQEKILELERQSPKWSAGRCGGKRRRRRSNSLNDSLDLKTELERVREERDKLSKDKKKLKKELQGLDKGFFDEVEDLKYALQQSAQLNQKYEKTLRSMCNRFGVPFPFALNPQRTSTPIY